MTNSTNKFKAVDIPAADASPLNVPALAASHRVYANLVHWITIFSGLTAMIVPVFIMLFPDNNVLNPNLIFGAIFEGAKPAEIWSVSPAGSYPGAYYFMNFLSSPDSYAQLAIVTGCSVGLLATFPAAILQLTKEKDYLYGMLGVVFSVLILLSMTGTIG